MSPSRRALELGTDVVLEASRSEGLGVAFPPMCDDCPTNRKRFKAAASELGSWVAVPVLVLGLVLAVALAGPATVADVAHWINP